MWDWLKAQNEALASIESLLTSAAILAGGAWGWREYRRRRDPNPKARLHHAVAHRRLPGARLWLRTELHIENCGTTLLKLSTGLTRVSQVLPLDGSLPDRLPAPFSRERAWPSLLNDEKDWNEVAIEPGEKDMVVYDYIFPEGPETVIVYSHVENTSVKGTSFGWQVSTLYEIDGDGKSKRPDGAALRAAASEADASAYPQLSPPNKATGGETTATVAGEEVGVHRVPNDPRVKE